MSYPCNTAHITHFIIVREDVIVVINNMNHIVHVNGGILKNVYIHRLDLEIIEFLFIILLLEATNIFLG